MGAPLSFIVRQVRGAHRLVLHTNDLRLKSYCELSDWRAITAVMTNTDFFPRAAWPTLGFRTLTSLRTRSRSADRVEKAPAALPGRRRVIPIGARSYTGFSLAIRVVRPGAISSAIGRFATLQDRLMKSALIRVLFHCVCLLRGSKLSWHWAGIMRELRSK